MCPEISFKFAGVDISVYFYGLFTVLAALTGCFIAFFTLRHAGLKLTRILLLLAAMAAGFLIGARLWNYAVNPGAYDEIFTLFTLRLANFSLYGGVTGSIVVFMLMTLRDREKRWHMLDALVLPSAVAFAIARVGCFLNGCCGGKATNSWLGVDFPPKGNITGILTLPILGNVNMPSYPTQLFELVLALIGLIPALLLRNNQKVPSGVPFLVYGAWFTGVRWAILPLRELPYSDYIVTIVYPIIYALMIICGCVLIAVRIRKKG